MREVLRVVWITTMTFPVFYHSFYLLYFYFICLYNILGETLAKTQSLLTSFARGFFRVEEFTDLLVFVNYV